MARFTLVVDLDAFTDDVRAGVRVTANPSPPSYPEAGVGIHTGPESEVTDATGVATFDLVSLPDLTYLVTGDGFDPVRISGDVADGTTVRLDEALEVAPSIIAPTTAAELRAEIADRADAADVTALGTRVTAVEADVTAAAGTATWAGIPDKPTSFPPDVLDPDFITILSTKASTSALTSGLATKADASTVADLVANAPSSAFSPLKAMLAEAGSRPVAIQVIGDSTGNDATEWPRLVANHIRATVPAYTVQEVLYNVATETAPPPTVLQTGTAGAQYLSVVAGQTTPAIPQASAPAFPAVLDLRVKLAADDWTTTTGGGVIMGRENGAGQRSWYVSLAASGYPQIVLSSDGTALTTMHNGGFAVPFADGATGWVRWLYTANDGAGNRVLKTYTSTDGVTWTQLGTTTTTAGAITPFSPTNANLTIGGRGGGSGLPGKIYEVHMLNAENGADLVPPLPGSWPMTPTGTPMSIVGAPVLTLVNGSYSGANAAILSDSTRLAKMTPNYGQKIAFISDSHNEGGLVDAAFIATYDALVEAVRARLPGVPMVLLTQNPENGATNQVAHAARRWNIVTYGQAKGHETRDTFKAIADDPRGLAALMADTLHPNADGSAVWAGVITDAYDNATT